MFKSRILSALALAALLGAAACGDSGEQQNEAGAAGESPTAQPTEQPVDPAVTQGAVIMDTSAVGQPATGTPGADTTAAGQ